MQILIRTARSKPFSDTCLVVSFSAQTVYPVPTRVPQPLNGQIPQAGPRMLASALGLVSCATRMVQSPA